MRTIALSIKVGLFLIIFTLAAQIALSHVCGDVVSGSQVGCPDPQTAEYVSSSASDTRFTIVTDIIAKRVQFKQGACSCTGTEADGCYDNNNYGPCNVDSCYLTGFTLERFVYTVKQGDRNDLAFSSNPGTPYALTFSATPIIGSKTQRFSIYIDIEPQAPAQHFNIDIGMEGSLSSTVRPIYTLEFDWTPEGCSGDGDCSFPMPYCVNSNCVECRDASHCNDQNPCTTDSCSSNSCSHAQVIDGTTCAGGFCCSGSCATSVQNSGFAAACRTDPSCSGALWGYWAANNGNLCQGDCTVCSSGLCNTYDDDECDAEESCQSGTCVSTCSDECTANRCVGSSQYQLCSTGDDCNVWGSTLSCPDNRCTEPTCTGNGQCGETAVSAATTDEACTGSTGCTGGDCKCDGSGHCTSQPECSNPCSSGQRDCQGDAFRTCIPSGNCWIWSTATSCDRFYDCNSGYCTHESDTDNDRCIENSELNSFISSWKSNSDTTSIESLISAIDTWKNQAGCS